MLLTVSCLLSERRGGIDLGLSYVAVACLIVVRVNGCCCWRVGVALAGQQVWYSNWYEYSRSELRGVDKW